MQKRTDSVRRWQCPGPACLPKLRHTECFWITPWEGVLEVDNANGQAAPMLACMLVLVLVKEGEVCAHEAVVGRPHGRPKHDLIHVPAPAFLLQAGH